MATLSVQTVGALAGANITFTAASAAGDKFPNNGKTMLLMRNGHASAARTVTADRRQLCKYGVDHNDVTVVPAQNKVAVSGFFKKDEFNDEQGFVNVSYSDSGADVEVAAVELR